MALSVFFGSPAQRAKDGSLWLGLAKENFDAGSCKMVGIHQS